MGTHFISDDLKIGANFKMNVNRFSVRGVPELGVTVHNFSGCRLPMPEFERMTRYSLNRRVFVQGFSHLFSLTESQILTRIQSFGNFRLVVYVGELPAKMINRLELARSKQKIHFRFISYVDFSMEAPE